MTVFKSAATKNEKWAFADILCRLGGKGSSKTVV
jgi:hypothetical protein